ncbi:uncharacterized protein LY79DRAFT_274965 [Colletotrichum navitas]|uniref:Uncharacterized protein n=1 Tax=Colletotrichum navitas TaxID=681940 RepID=A0AAD8V3U3_9PEZI|nr:uncharacterized protein LY79DRAFT_274965 [Colletotrichum navitas]KAK1585265.1 hypothetical protein LY79DRAFT_274965 [Colletotrichum navitas]
MTLFLPILPMLVLRIGSHRHKRSQSPGSQKHSNSGSDCDWKGCHPHVRAVAHIIIGGDTSHPSITAIGSPYQSPLETPHFFPLCYHISAGSRRSAKTPRPAALARGTSSPGGCSLRSVTAQGRPCLAGEPEMRCMRQALEPSSPVYVGLNQQEIHMSPRARA